MIYLQSPINDSMYPSISISNSGHRLSCIELSQGDFFALINGYGMNRIISERFFFALINGDGDESNYHKTIIFKRKWEIKSASIYIWYIGLIYDYHCVLNR